jgi:acyl carrier protein
MEADVSPDTLMAAVRDGLQAQDTGAVRDAAIEYLRSLIRSGLEIDDSEELPAGARVGELGVDSLLALEMQDWIKEDLGVFLNPAELSYEPTLAEMAEMLIGELTASLS